MESAKLDKKPTYYTFSLAGDGFQLAANTSHAFSLLGRNCAVGPGDEPGSSLWTRARASAPAPERYNSA